MGKDKDHFKTSKQKSIKNLLLSEFFNRKNSIKIGAR